MNSKAFTPEQIAWLREHAPGTYFAQLTAEFNRIFGQSRSQAAIVSACFYRGIGNGLKSKNLEDLEVKGKKYRFKPGYVPPNKGVKGYSTNDPQKLARMQKTQFKKGKPNLFFKECTVLFLEGWVFAWGWVYVRPKDLEKRRCLARSSRLRLRA